MAKFYLKKKVLKGHVYLDIAPTPPQVVQKLPLGDLPQIWWAFTSPYFKLLKWASLLCNTSLTLIWGANSIPRNRSVICSWQHGSPLEGTRMQLGTAFGSSSATYIITRLLRLVKSTYCPLQICQLCPGHNFSGFDYCCALYVGLALKAARLPVKGHPSCLSPGAPPIVFSAQFKLLVTACKAFYSVNPKYSSSLWDLQKRAFTPTEIFLFSTQEGACSVMVPKGWNSLSRKGAPDPSCFTLRRRLPYSGLLLT